MLDGDGHPVAGATVRALTGGQEAPRAPSGRAQDDHRARSARDSAQVDEDRLRRFSGRTAAPAAPDRPVADPQFVVRGELGVMVGPIPPIPPPGAQVARPTAIVDPTAAGAPGLVGEPPPLAVDPARASIWITGVRRALSHRAACRGQG